MEFPDKPVAQLLGANGPIHAVTYSARHGTYILTGSDDRAVRLYNPSSTSSINSSARLIQTYPSHGYPILSLAVANDNAHFVSASGDRLFLWDVASATTTHRFACGTPSAKIHAVCFAGQGDSLLVSGGFDTLVRVWDTRQAQRNQEGVAGRPLQVLSGARDAISAVVVTGHEVVAGSVDGRVRTYDVRMGRLTTDVLGTAVTSLCLGSDAKTLLVGGLDGRLRLMDRERGTALRVYQEDGWRNRELRVQSLLGGTDTWVLVGDEGEPEGGGEGTVWAWDLMTGKLIARVAVPSAAGAERKTAPGQHGQGRERRNVVSCLAWRHGGEANQYCAGGSSGVVTVFGCRGPSPG